MTHSELTAAGFEVDAETHARLARFIDLLLDESRRVNLTAVREPAAAWVVHVCDSLALLPLIDELPPERLIDIGTGGGVPGVPLAIARPQVEVTLLDATRKKADAVRRMCASLGLNNINVVSGRAETLAHEPECREKFGAAVARAVAKVPTLVELAAGFVRVGGEVWLPKLREDVESETRAARRAIAACEVELRRVLDYALPGRDEARSIIVYEKTAPLAAEFPRAAGDPQRRPL